MRASAEGFNSRTPKPMAKPRTTPIRVKISTVFSFIRLLHGVERPIRPPLSTSSVTELAGSDFLSIVACVCLLVYLGKKRIFVRKLLPQISGIIVQKTSGKSKASKALGTT